jgi:hypothetical protein
VTGYQAPKTRLHRDFLYLDDDAVLNSLSALEAGKVDEIIQKVSEAKEGGLEGSIGAGPVKGGGRRKKLAGIEEQLVKTRTRFSAFDAWYRYLADAGAFGRFDEWDEDVRNAMSIGDTLEFTADIELAPIHKLLATFVSYAESAGTKFGVKGAQLNETRQTAQQMRAWFGGKSGRMHLPIYLRPGGIDQPRILGALQDPYLIGDRENMEGTFTVIAQVSSLLEGDHVLSMVRVIRDVPPTPAEVATISEAMLHFVEPAKELGVDLDESDINVTAPGVVVRPIAIYQ